MAGGARDVVIKISIRDGKMQSGFVCVDEFSFLLLPVFILAVKN
jgi:hypothetical protein